MKKDNRYSAVGGRHRALSRYYMILNRLKSTDREKNKKYQGIQMLIDKDTFIEWFMKNDFAGASVDRIDKDGNYTLDNIQLIPLDENIRKDKIKAKGECCECFACKETKPLELFVADKRRINGHGTICKKCDNARRRRNSKKSNKGDT